MAGAICVLEWERCPSRSASWGSTFAMSTSSVLLQTPKIAGIIGFQIHDPMCCCQVAISSALPAILLICSVTNSKIPLPIRSFSEIKYQGANCVSVFLLFVRSWIDLCKCLAPSRASIRLNGVKLRCHPPVCDGLSSVC